MTWRCQVRHARASDVTALAALRNHYVAHGVATFDEVPFTDDDIARWVAASPNAGPHHLFVACDGAQVLGYCSSQAYRAHPAFRDTAETSIYVSPHATRRGVGDALYRHLFEVLDAQALHRVLVGIALPNEASEALHARFGFTRVGVFDEYAVKAGRRISSVWMERRHRPAPQLP